MTDQHRDPFEDLARPVEARQPRPSFARDLRTRLAAELGIDERTATIDLPERKPMPTTQTSPVLATAVTPYLTARDGSAALDWYGEAFGAVESFRVVGDDGTLGHAEFTIGDARFMLSDEHPAIGVVSPTTLGGTPISLHLTVGDVDGLFTRAVTAGATSMQEPADQPHGARHGTIVDPFGHRWMLSQQLEELGIGDYAQRAEGSGYRVEAARPRPHGHGGIWAGVSYRDALAGIRFLVDVFGFEEQLVVTGDDGTTVVHSQIQWPEGGIIQAGTYEPDNEFMQAPGAQSVYVITADPQSVWGRCQAAGVEVVREPESPDYDPEGMGFSVRDPEGNIFSFGTYAGTT
ncbi:MAG: VOC family protein [Acidimicrobiales bacterium]